MNNPAYIVYDIETYPDYELFRQIKHPELTVEEAVKTLAEEQGKEQAFLPPTYHLPISIAVLKVAATLEPMDRIQTITDGTGTLTRADLGTRRFFEGIESWSPVLVDFNGRNFDLQVLTANALRIGVSCPRFFGKRIPLHTDYRYRYGDMHIDLQDWLSAGSGHFPGGMNLASRLSGGAGKDGMDGSMVAGMYEESLRLGDTGPTDKIDAYCRQDVFETYRVFLRTRVMTGSLTLARADEYMASIEKW